MTGTIDNRLEELGIALPMAASPAANYVPYTVSGNLVYVAGQITLLNNDLKFVGKVGEEYSVDEGYQAARLCGLNLIAQVKEACHGELEHVKKVVKLTGFVNCRSDFTDQPKVINGASDLMVEVFGDRGKHARAAVGAASLPLGVAVEVEGIFEVGF